jgi:hypothetical protein
MKEIISGLTIAFDCSIVDDFPQFHRANYPTSQQANDLMSQLLGSHVLYDSSASYSIHPMLGGGIVILLPSIEEGASLILQRGQGNELTSQLFGSLVLLALSNLSLN